MIPEGWKNKSLDAVTDSVASIRYGVVQIGPHTPDGVPIVAIKFINRIASAPLHRASNAIEARYKNSRVQSGDVLLSVKGTVGEVGVVPPGFKGNIAREIARIRPRENVRADYLAYQLQAPETQGRIKAVTVGSTRLEFSISAVKKFEILLPPLPEQRRIAEILATWDRAIETVEALIANARAQKEALMQSLLTGKHRLPGFSGSTRSVSLSEVACIETGSSNREDSLDIGEFTFFDRSTDVRRSDRFLFDAEAIIIGGEGQEFIPKYFVGKFDLHQRAYALHSFNNAFGRYIFYAAHHSRHLLRRYAVGSTVASLRMPTFQKVKIWLPSVEEQIAIADHLTLADDGLEGLSTQLTALRQEKSALMQQLLTGKRRVNLTESEHS